MNKAGLIGALKAWITLVVGAVVTGIFLPLFLYFFSLGFSYPKIGMGICVSMLFLIIGFIGYMENRDDV